MNVRSLSAETDGDEGPGSDEPMIIWHPMCPLLAGCPLAHLRAYHLDPQTGRVLERELGEAATAGDLLPYWTAGTLRSIRGVGAVRAAELDRVLGAGGLVRGGQAC